MPALILIAILVVVILAVGASYNGMITSRNRVDEAESDIHVQMRRRYDLIPNLVETVKGYTKHEEGVFTSVTEARAAAMGASGKGVGAEQQAEQGLSSALKSVFAIAEAYPELKAADNFQQLSAELSETEDKLEAARRFYNATVRDYNTRIQTIPGNLVAGMGGFKTRELYAIETEAAKQPVAVSF